MGTIPGQRMEDIEVSFLSREAGRDHCGVSLGRKMGASAYPRSLQSPENENLSRSPGSRKRNMEDRRGRKPGMDV